MNIIKELESKRAESAIERRYTECFNNISCFTPIAANTLVFGYLTGAIRIISLGDLLGNLFEHPAGYRKPERASDGASADGGAAAAAAGGTASSAPSESRGGDGALPGAANVFHDAIPTGGAIDVMHAHGGSVTKLLHPFYHGATVDSSIFVSGSADCCIKVWNLGTHLHTFKNQAGVVVNLLCPPANSSLLRRGCFCSISSDHSFAIYSIDAMSCMHMISGLSAPVHEVRWRAADDYVVLWCGGEHNHTVYVWQLSSGHLDRKATGQLALDILAACPAPAPAHGLAGHVTRKVLLAQGIGFQVCIRFLTFTLKTCATAL
jgi:WD40 repeat protein